MAFKKKIYESFIRFRTPLMTALLGVSVWGGWLLKGGLLQQQPKVKTTRVAKAATQSEPERKVQNPVANVAYRTDTLSRAVSTLLFYNRGMITRNYVEKNNSYRLQLPYFAHEDWHHHNEETGYRRRYYFTPIEYYKLCMHDEISANIAAVLTARYEYLAAATKAEKKEIIKRYKSTYMKFYFEAVEKGKIHPQSRNSKDFEQEMRFIANGTQKMWLKIYAAHYAPRTYRMLQRYVARSGLVKDSKKNYNHILGKMYTIGGVNFAQYMDCDIDTADDKVRLAEQLRTIKTMRSGGLKMMNYVIDSYSLMQKVSANAATEAFQNLLISAQLKYMLQDKTPEELRANPQLVNLCFIKIMSKVRADRSFKDAVRNYPLISDNRLNLNRNDKTDDEAIRQMYRFKDLDLLAMIPSYEREALPIRNLEKHLMFENFSTDYVTAIDTEQSEDTEPKSYLPQYIRSEELPADNVMSQKQHISEVQYMVIPNLREPILTAASAEDYFRILQCMREFAAMPQVLKECDTAAQQKFLRRHPEFQKQNSK